MVIFDDINDMKSKDLDVATFDAAVGGSSSQACHGILQTFANTKSRKRSG